MKIFNHPILLTSFSYRRGDIQVNSSELYTTMKTVKTGRTVGGLVIAISILLFFYSILFSYFWYTAKKKHPYADRIFKYVTLGFGNAEDITVGHMLSLVLLMMGVAMFVATGLQINVIRSIFIKLIGGILK